MDFTAFLATPQTFLFYAVAFVVALSVIVAVHEYGHYIVGRWSGIKADVFSLGFGPVIFSRTDRHGTKWQFAALPFGGYVKFRGDANAASGKDAEAMEELSPEELRQTMHGAPLWARAATVAAGPLFNFAMSIVVFAGVIAFKGQAMDPIRVGEVLRLPGPAAQGLMPGDLLLTVEGAAVPSYRDAKAVAKFEDGIPQKQVLIYGVERDGKKIEVEGPYLFPTYVSKLTPKSAAYEAGIEQGDVVVAVDGTPIFAFDQLLQRVEGGGGKPLDITVWRDGQEKQFKLIPKRTDEPKPEGGFKTNWRIGIFSTRAFVPATEFPGVGEAVSGGFSQTWRIMTGSLSGLYHMVTGAISSCNMAGPISIAKISGATATQGVSDFIWFIAVLSTAVGLLNLFPIPVLDGGHLVFYAYEAVAGKPPSDRALQIMMSVGLAFILTLMLFALGNDLFCP